MYCKNCGKMLSSDAKFCSECGTKVVVEAPKPQVAEPMFFTKEVEPAPAPAKPKKVVHLEEFNWDLEGYPTTPKKTEDVDFNWASVLEEKARNTAPKTTPVKQEEPEEEITVEELVEALPEDAETEVSPEVSEEADKSLEEEIFENLESAPIDEPTKLIDKEQIKIEGVDKFYTFNNKQAEFQGLLDEEYERIQNGEIDEEEEIFEIEKPPLPDFLVEDSEPVEEPVEAPAEELVEEAAVELVEEAAEELPEEVAADEEEAPAETIAESELVAVVWAKAPAGIVVETKAETEAEPAEESEAEAEDISPSKGEEEKTDSDEKEKSEPEHKLTFDDIFRDDDDDEDEKEKGGCLKAIAIILCILVIIELGILGVQYFAPDSQAGAYIDKAYNYLMGLVTGSEAAEEPEEVEGPSEVEQIISAQMEKNENIVSVVENKRLFFEEGEDYGYEEFADTYAFQNSPWYDDEEGQSVSFGDEIIGTLIQYYSALSDKMNDVNNDVIDFVDDTSAFYEEVDSIEGADDKGYVINSLEIGEIRTGASGFYVLARVTTVDSQNTAGETETQVVYLEPNTSKKEMKIIEIQKI